MKIKTIAFDADDTLWHNERIFLSVKEKYKRLLAEYHSDEWIEQRLDETESRNIQHFGYGVKGFTLSMIETACELTENRISADKINEIIGYAREMLASPIDLLPEVKETIHELSHRFDLMVITKGDLFDQEAKLARSGLGDFFSRFEIVSQKNAATYQRILAKHDIKNEEFVMVGNSLRSDILPVVEIGSNAVFIEYESEWIHEKVEENELEGKIFTRLENLSRLPEWIKENF
jgi:putative hydrolase of the HAD superfamily